MEHWGAFANNLYILLLIYKSTHDTNFINIGFYVNYDNFKNEYLLDKSKNISYLSIENSNILYTRKYKWQKLLENLKQNHVISDHKTTVNPNKLNAKMFPIIKYIKNCVRGSNLHYSLFRDQ